MQSKPKIREYLSITKIYENYEGIYMSKIMSVLTLPMRQNKMVQLRGRRPNFSAKSALIHKDNKAGNAHLKRLNTLKLTNTGGSKVVLSLLIQVMNVAQALNCRIKAIESCLCAWQ